MISDKLNGLLQLKPFSPLAALCWQPVLCACTGTLNPLQQQLTVCSSTGAIVIPRITMVTAHTQEGVWERWREREIMCAENGGWMLQSKKPSVTQGSNRGGGLEYIQGWLADSWQWLCDPKLLEPEGYVQDMKARKVPTTQSCGG